MVREEEYFDIAVNRRRQIKYAYFNLFKMGRSVGLNDLRILRAVIQSGAELYRLGCENNYVDVVKMAIRQDPNVVNTSDGQNSLQRAISEGQLDVVRFVLNLPVPQNLSSLIRAGIQNPYSFRFLSNRFEDKSQLIKNILNMSRDYRLMSGFVFKQLYRYGANINQIFLASCYGNDASAVKYLLDRGADIHTDNDQGIDRACFHKRKGVVKLLIDYGADVTTRDLTHATVSMSITPATQKQIIDILDLLYRHSVVPNDRTILTVIHRGLNQVLKYIIQIEPEIVKAKVKDYLNRAYFVSFVPTNDPSTESRLSDIVQQLSSLAE